jgi:hypothetical protein
MRPLTEWHYPRVDGVALHGSPQSFCGIVRSVLVKMFIHARMAKLVDARDLSKIEHSVWKLPM